MRVTATMTNEGIKREIDFQGATLPDGRQIQNILDENEHFKKNISNLEKDLKEKTSIFAKIIPWKWARDSLEIIMFVFGIVGIVSLFM